MSTLFSPINIGRLSLPNRFVRSATLEGMAEPTGEVSDRLIRHYVQIAKGGTGMAVTGFMFVHPAGRGCRHQTGIHHDDMLPGLSRLTGAVHRHNGRIAFQLVHCGRQTTKKIAGRIPLAPSSRGRDPVNFVKPAAMTPDDIQATIASFQAAAQRAVAAEADAIQIHGAHGYLISEFLSPYFNTRSDQWGGSDANRFRFLKEVIRAIKSSVPAGFPILVKLNGNDYTPKQGVTPALAAKYAGWLRELGIDGVEVSCGTALYSFMNLCRGKVPTRELVRGLPWWKKPAGRLLIGKMEGKYDLEEGYNLSGADAIRASLGDTPLFLVGGFRSLATMEAVLAQKRADLICMSRPFIRDPLLVKKFESGETTTVSCRSCNRCLAAVVNDMPVGCYFREWPHGKRG